MSDSLNANINVAVFQLYIFPYRKDVSGYINVKKLLFYNNV